MSAASLENRVASELGSLKLTILTLQTQLEAKNAVLIDLQKKAADKEKTMTSAYEEAVAEIAGLKAQLAELVQPAAPDAPVVDLGEGH